MFNFQDFHLHFSYQGTAYDIALIKGGKSDFSVVINGTTYAVLGNKEKIKTACDFLNAVSLESVSSLEDLKERLVKLNDLSSPRIRQATEIGTQILHTKSTTEIPAEPSTIQEAYTSFIQGLEAYAADTIGKGALLVKVVGIEGIEEFKAFGQFSVDNPTPVDENTIGRTGSGAKLWAALLSKIITKKHSQYIKMDDKLEKFAQKEALRKFGRIGTNGQDVVEAELAKEISLESLLAMTAGLEYEDKAPKEATTATLDELMSTLDAIKDGSIHFVYDPRDRISAYSNNIGLVAYPLEKAYKKVLIEELIQQKILSANQPVKQLEQLREELKAKIEEVETHIKQLRETQDLSSIGEYEQQLHSLQADLQHIPATLQDLLDYPTAYVQEIYLYQILDEILEPSGNHHVTYAEIMKRELLDPMGMDHSGFYGTEGQEMAVTYIDPTSKQQESKAPPHENVMLQGAGGGRTTLTDASKLVQGLSNPKGLIDQKGHVLLEPDDLQEVFSPHGHYKNWGLGGSEVLYKGGFIEKGGSFNQDTYTFWVDRTSRVGLIAMCNCDKQPVHLLETFKRQIQALSYPTPTDEKLIREKQNTPIEMSIQEYAAHPVVSAQEYYEGTRGKIALLFDLDKDQEGIMHWSGTPFHVSKREDGKFRITTPGRFENVEIWKVKGKYTEQDYLAVADTSFIKTSVSHIPSQNQVAIAQRKFSHFSGDYINPKRPEWGIFRFKILGEGENVLLGACEVKEKSQVKDFVPLGIINVEPNAISFNGHDRQPPDKIFRFVRDSKEDPWYLQVTDVSSPELVIDERMKSL